MTDLERCKQALEDGDATAFVAVADALVDLDDPRGEELAGLAQDIVTSEDWSIAYLSAIVFISILEKGDG